jgi:pimeloyl-ACP methyl ester carboxylesterase
VTVDRLPALGGHRVGSLVFDPGGPGGSGTEFVYGESLGAQLFSAGVREHFDLIGFDPRGVSLSELVRCDPVLLNQRVSLFPSTEAGFRRLLAHNRLLGASCRRLTGPLLEHVDTLSVARDLEVLRQALGEGRLNYLGLSYGTQLGSTYAKLYPTRFRVLALDGALPHSLPATTLFADEAAAYETALHRFASWCAQTPTCVLHGRPVLPLFDRLVAAADRHPIPAPGCSSGRCRRSVTGQDIRLNAQDLLLFNSPIPLVAPYGWNDLAIALRKAAVGDATAFSSPLANSPADPGANGSALAIECLDWPDPVHTLADLQRFEGFGRVVAPHLRGASQSWTILTGCIGWPASVVNPPRPLTVVGTPPILLVNATHDPSTPYVWAQELASELRTSVLLTRAGDGHTSYLVHGPSRTRDAIERYLLTGRTPPPGTVYDN